MTSSPHLMMNRVTFAIRAFFLSFFSFFTIGFAILMLYSLPQVRETIESFDSDRFSQIPLFAVAEFYWALCAWFCARLMLERRFFRPGRPFEPLLPGVRPGFARALVKWAPRALGFAATLPMLFVAFRSQQDAWLRVLSLLFSALFVVFVLLRRKV